MSLVVVLISINLMGIALALHLQRRVASASMQGYLTNKIWRLKFYKIVRNELLYI